MHRPEIPDRLGLTGQYVAEKYLVDQVVGDGGFGLVYRATHKMLCEPVAIKFFTAHSSAPEEMREELLEGFVREGRLMSELSTHSASIVQARDMGSLTLESGEWIPFLVLEWLEGETLAAKLDAELVMGAQARSLEDAVLVLQGPAQALSLAHSLGVAHLDVKPDNFFVCGSRLEAGVQIKLLDFGVSKVFDDQHLRASLPITRPLPTLTPDYAAPEMFDRSMGELGPQSDVFSFALLVLELMRGGVPVMAEGDVSVSESFELIRSRCLDPRRRPTPRDLGLRVSDEVEAVFARALAVQVDTRYRDLQEFWDALTQAAGMESFRSPRVTTGLNEAARGVFHDRGAASRPAKGRAGTSAASPSKSIAAVVIGSTFVLGAAALVLFDDGAPAPQSASLPVLEGELSSEQAATLTAPVERCPAGMRFVPGGRFYRGSDEEAPALAAARPAHPIRLEAYCLDEREVSLADYRRCSQQGKCKRAFRRSAWKGAKAEHQAAYSSLCNENYADRGQHPVNCVTWHQAREYCEVKGFRLPQEAEWEFAARGADGRVFPWGDQNPGPEHANVCGSECSRWREEKGLEKKRSLFDADDGFPGTAPVGSFEAGRAQWGHLDLVGNLFEWTASEYLAYPKAVGKIPGLSTKKKKKHVIRGGAFNSFNADFANPALRYGMLDNTHSHGIGFRCASDPLGGDGAGQ